MLFKKTKKEHRVILYFTEEEKEKIKALALENGLRASPYIRFILMEKLREVDNK